MAPPETDEINVFAEHFRTRVLQEVLADALASSWIRRAIAFENAMHKPGDFPGRCSAVEIARINARLAEKARLCRAHAGLVEFQKLDSLLEDLAESA